MIRVRYFKCKKCEHLIRYLFWNIGKEKEMDNLVCPQCSSKKSFTILTKRPYYRMKHLTYLSISVSKNGEKIVVSK